MSGVTRFRRDSYVWAQTSVGYGPQCCSAKNKKWEIVPLQMTRDFLYDADNRMEWNRI